MELEYNWVTLTDVQNMLMHVHILCYCVTYSVTDVRAQSRRIMQHIMLPMASVRQRD